MCKWQWKVFSVLTMLAMALAMCPPTAAGAAWNGIGTITGNIEIGIPDLNLTVHAYPVGGSERHCFSDSVNFVDNTAPDADYYEYSISGCDPALDYDIVPEGDGYTFDSTAVLAGDFDAVTHEAPADSVAPVERKFTGKVTYTDGVTRWKAGLNIDYVLYNNNGTDPADGTPGTATTNALGEFTIWATDASTLHIPPIDYVDGYNTFETGDWVHPPWRSDVVWDFKSSGTRNIHGHIDTLNGLHKCASGVTITATAPGALTKTTLTDGDGGFGLDGLEPRGPGPDQYTIAATKSGCVFTPNPQTIDISAGNGQQPIVFYIPNTGVWGKVKTTLGQDVSLAYYLIATYTTGGVSYSNAVNWTDGSYWIQVPPGTGTLTISRIGGSAAFGYETASATRSVIVEDDWKEENFTLVPNRTINGTILGQNAVPVQRNATVDFGYGLKWTPSAPSAAYSIKAQPKLYYLSPVENGILGSSPARFLANLTTAPSWSGANFTVTWRTYRLQGCLRDLNGNDYLTLSPTSTRFRPATGYGTVTYPATLQANGCGLGTYRYSLQLPKGIAGAMEVDGHTLRGNSIDGMNWDEQRDYDLMGPRAVTGRIYSANPNLDINGDFRGGNGFLILRDAATNYIVDTDGDMQRSHEFTIPMLEAKNYTLSINPDQVPQGYDAQPYRSLMVTANLASADYDIPALTGFLLAHKPIPPISATGGGYFLATAATQRVGSAPPERNDQDWIRGFHVQYGLATNAFYDTNPMLAYYDYDEYMDGDGVELTGLTVGQLYRWRVRAVYEYDMGPWLETTPRPVSPTTQNNNANYQPGQPIGPVTFTWERIAPFVGFGQRFTNSVSAGTNVTLEMDDTGDLAIGDFVRVVADDGHNEIATITAVSANANIVVNVLNSDYDTGYVYRTLNPNKVRYHMYYTSTSYTGSLISNGGANTVTTTVNPAIGKDWSWYVQAQYNTTGTTWIPISNYSPTQTFFNRYKNITPGPSYTEDDLGWDINPVRFFAIDTNNAGLPANAYYQVELHDPSRPDDYYYWTFPRATHSVYQFPDSLPNGNYAWRIGIVQGNDEWAPLITNWTNGAGNITVVH